MFCAAAMSVTVLSLSTRAQAAILLVFALRLGYASHQMLDVSDVSYVLTPSFGLQLCTQIHYDAAEQIAVFASVA